MTDHLDLEQIYADAKSAIKEGDYDHARDLLTSILAVDENYRDTSRLLAQTIRLRRRRWYNHPALWTVIGLIVLIGIGILIAPKLQGSLTGQIPRPAQHPTIIQPLQATAVFSPTPAPTTAPTSIPLTWARLNLAQFLGRETIHTIAINPSDPDVIYVGFLNAGVFKSIDGGVSWQPAQNGMAGASIDTLVIDPQEPDTLYAGVYRGGLYRTTDGGANWVSYGPKFEYGDGVDSIVLIDPRDHLHLYYAPKGLYFESRDGGRTWSNIIPTCPDQVGALILDPADQSLYASQYGDDGACPAGVYHYQSGAHGWTWTLVGLEAVENINGLFMGTDSGGDKLLIANSQALPGHVYFSTDDGKSWTMKAILCITIAVDPQTPTTLYCGKRNGGILKSTDGGSSWKSILWAVFGDTFQAISVLAGPSPHLVAGSTEVAISTDQGASWNNYESGLAGQPVDLMIDPSNASIFYLKYNDQYVADCHPLYRSMDAGHTWKLISSTGCSLTFGPGGTDLYRVTITDNGYAGILGNEIGGLLLHSADQGAHWDTQFIPSGCDHVFANPFTPGTLITSCSTKDPPSVYFYSNDFGKHWQPFSDVGGPIYNVGFYFGGSAGQRVYAIYASDYRSDDGGKSWQPCGDPGAPSSSSDSRLIIDPQNPDHIIRTSEGAGILISTDGCRSWTKSNNGLGSLLVNTLAHDPKNMNTIYAGTDGGAYVSFNGGQSWGQINDGLLGETVVYSIVVDPQSNVYAATPYGIFQLEKK